MRSPALISGGIPSSYIGASVEFDNSLCDLLLARGSNCGGEATFGGAEATSTLSRAINQQKKQKKEFRCF